MRHHELRVEVVLAAEPVAGRAGAGRIVEREHARLEARHGEAAFRAGVAAREQQRFQFRIGPKNYSSAAAAELECGLEGLGEALREFRPGTEAVDYRFDRVAALSVEADRRVEL